MNAKLTAAQWRALWALPVEIGSYGAPRRSTLRVLVERKLARVRDFSGPNRYSLDAPCDVERTPAGDELILLDAAQRLGGCPVASDIGEEPSCRHCGSGFGLHRASDNLCPGTHLDGTVWRGSWDRSPGTAFDPLCEFCGKRPATCRGRYEDPENPISYACDECCGHGCEDGHCEAVAGVPSGE